jgi:hypothetical protein
MMERGGFVRQVLTAALAAFAIVTGAVAQPASSAPTEAQIQRFLASMPNQGLLTGTGPEREPAYVASMIARNPGREEEAGALIRAYATCTGPAGRAAMVRQFRRIAMELGAERVVLMTRFYERQLQRRFAFLSDRGTQRSAAETRELAALVRDYPLEAFARAVQSSQASFLQDRALGEAIAPCLAVFRAEAERRGLAYRDVPVR